MSALPSSFPLHREHESMIAAAKRYAANNYTAGVAEGKRQARTEAAKYTGLVLVIGTCFGVMLAVVAGGWLA